MGNVRLGFLAAIGLIVVALTMMPAGRADVTPPAPVLREVSALGTASGTAVTVPEPASVLLLGAGLLGLAGFLRKAK
jgi:hypothetical protein